MIHFSDLPDRTAAFADYHALFLALAEEEGNYSVKGDHNGNIAIVDVNVTFLDRPPTTACPRWPKSSWFSISRCPTTATRCSSPTTSAIRPAIRWTANRAAWARSRGTTCR